VTFHNSVDDGGQSVEKYNLEWSTPKKMQEELNDYRDNFFHPYSIQSITVFSERGNLKGYFLLGLVVI